MNLPDSIFCCLGGVILMTLSLPGTAQTSPSSVSSGWQISTAIIEESVGQGLPVLALDRTDWANYVTPSATSGRSFRGLKAEIVATNVSGWRVGALARSQAWMDASPDAVTIAVLNARGVNPDAERHFQLTVRSESWQGRGIMLGTPWWKLDATALWKWQAEVSLLRLQQFGVAELAGDVSYRGAGAYDFDVHSQRSSPSITGRFLPASEDAGVGASLSLSLQGQLAPDWRIAVRADDIASALKWSNLATDSSELNSQVTSRDADGSLVYGPLLKGKKALLPVSSQIGVHWQAEVGWAMLASQGQSRELTLRVSRQANISQSWFGFDSRYQSRATPHWRLEFEPVWRTAQLALAWGGWHVIVGTDGRGVESRYRQLKIGWESEL